MIYSNMGFKISISLAAGGANNWVALPYFNSYPNGASIFNNITNCTQVSRWDLGTAALQTYDGPRSYNFNTTAGEAYLVKVLTATNWVVVGSHNPSLQVSLVGAGATNWVSIPYHTTAATVDKLWSQIPNIGEISYWDPINHKYIVYTGGIFDPKFAIVPGRGYVIKIGGASSTWVPAHY